MKPSEDCVWLHGEVHVESAEVARMCGLSAAELQELVDDGSLPTVGEGVFRSDLVPPLREASRVRALFDLDLFTVGLLVHYLQRIDQLERQVRGLSNAQEA